MEEQRKKEGGGKKAGWDRAGKQRKIKIGDYLMEEREGKRKPRKEKRNQGKEKEEVI